MAPPGMPSSFDEQGFREETRWQKFTRKLKQEPLIPFGTALTCFALYKASRSIRAGDHDQTNRMFRARIYAQFFTILCIVGGSYYYQEENQKRKVFESAIAQKKDMEKRDAWIRELEARDQEEKEERARKEARIARMQKPINSIRDKDGKDVKESKLQSSVNSALEERERRKVGVVEAVRQLGLFGR